MPSISCGDSSIDARLDALLREGVAFSLLSLAFETRVDFRGEVSHAPRCGGVSFTGLARLAAPFELEAAIDLWVDAAGEHSPPNQKRRRLPPPRRNPPYQ